MEVDQLASQLENLAPVPGSSSSSSEPTLSFRAYKDEDDLPDIMDLVERELSEPYVIYTYRYFLLEWPQLCFMCYAHSSDDPETETDVDSSPTDHDARPPTKAIAVGTIVCKQDVHRGNANRGYIAMLTTHPKYRKRGIARRLFQMAMDRMVQDGAEEIVLETEFDNAAALRFYEGLGFIREKRLHCFYLNRKDAMRLVRVVIRPEPASS